MAENGMFILLIQYLPVSKKFIIRYLPILKKKKKVDFQVKTTKNQLKPTSMIIWIFFPFIIVGTIFADLIAPLV